MKKLLVCLIGFLIFTVVSVNAVGLPTVQDFESSGQTNYDVTIHNGSSPVIENGAMKLLYETGQSNGLGFDRTSDGMYRKITAEWDFSILAGADGFGFVLLNTGSYGATGACPDVFGEEPSLPGTFGVGFDVYCKDYGGNLGEHEISLHWDGMERANRFSEFDFRGGAMRHAVLEIEYVTGGAEITLTVDGNYVYDHFLMEEMAPYESRAAFVGRTGGEDTVLYLDNLNVDFEEPCGGGVVPTEVTVFNAEQMWPGQGWAYKTVSLPNNETIYERVIMEVSLGRPSEGWDPWDRIMVIYATDDSGTRFEVARYITPYSKAWTWWMDVTDFQSILKGSRPFSLKLEHWSWDTGGFLVTAKLKYYIGDPKFEPYKVENLWNGQPQYGNPDDPISNFFTTRTLNIPADAGKVKIKTVVTGHGWDGNTENGAEFCRRGRTLSVAGGENWYSELWEQCYLNPCRPQSGTWYYPRAGWSPGDRVLPWDVDITASVTPGSNANVNYVADYYYNSNYGAGTANQMVESQVVYYREIPQLDLRWMFDEETGTTAAEISGSGYDGALINMDSSDWVGGITGSGLDFDGVNDHVEIAGFKGVIGTKSRTVAAWIKTTTIGEIISWGTAAAGEKWIFRVQDYSGTAGAIRLEVGGGGYVTGNTDVRDGNWHHVAAVLEDGDTDILGVKLYVDGQLETMSDSNGPLPVNTASSNTVKIGVFSSSGGYFTGQIDEVRIWNYGLSESHIYQAAVDVPLTDAECSRWKFDEGLGTTVTDNFGNGRGGTLTNMDPGAWVTGIEGSALDFDGVNDYVGISGYKGITGAQSRTVSAWVKTSTDGTIVHCGTGGPGGGNWMLHVNDIIGWGGVTGALRVSVGGGRVVGTTDLRDNAWHHVAVVLKNDGSPVPGELKLYVDGVLEVNSYSENGYTVNTVADADLLIGAYAGGAFPFTGLIDDVRIYDYALNDYEISTLARIPGDFDGDRLINMVDWTYIAERWLSTDCISPYCYQADMDESGDIGLGDVISFCQRWLQ